MSFSASELTGAERSPRGGPRCNPDGRDVGRREVRFQGHSDSEQLSRALNLRVGCRNPVPDRVLRESPASALGQLPPLSLPLAFSANSCKQHFPSAVLPFLLEPPLGTWRAALRSRLRRGASWAPLSPALCCQLLQPQPGSCFSPLLRPARCWSNASPEARQRGRPAAETGLRSRPELGGEAALSPPRALTASVDHSQAVERPCSPGTFRRRLLSQVAGTA